MYQTRRACIRSEHPESNPNQALTQYIETEADTASYESAQFYYDDDLEPAVQNWRHDGSYGAFAKRIDMSLDHINAGDMHQQKSQ